MVGVLGRFWGWGVIRLALFRMRQMVVGEGRFSFGRWFQIDWGSLSSPSFCSLWRSLMIWLMVC